LKRPGGQSQFSAQLAVQLTDRAPLAELQAWMVDHVADDLSVEALARRAAMSPRNFARVFAQSVGTTPARHVERLRVEAARRRLEESDAGVDVIAAQCGFGSRESLRRAFARTVRVSPSAYRARFAVYCAAGSTGVVYALFQLPAKNASSRAGSAPPAMMRPTLRLL
jgi:transcriptional regulator GlxA family with amidase domain